jgi:hypothetical protein
MTRPDAAGAATAPPPAEGKRLPWESIPPHLRADVARLLGQPVLRAVTQPGGFSPGVAARLELADGRRAFVKAVGDVSPESPGIHRAEAGIAAALPAGTPAARLLGHIDADGWVILLFEDIDGRLPVQPWRPDELSRVLQAMTSLARSLTPSPILVPPASQRYEAVGCGWRLLADSVEAGRDDLAGADPWIRGRLLALVALEDGFAAAAAGPTLAHGDIRADNVLLTADRVVFVDWPWACLAQPWFDLVAMLPSVTMQGGPDPQSVVTSHPLAAGADPAAITAVIAALGGTWTFLGRRPAPPGLPTLRPFQLAQADVCLRWLRDREPSL